MPTLLIHSKYYFLDLQVISSNRFISCSNDGQILLWEVEELSGQDEITAKVLNKFEDSDYVYSLSVFTTAENLLGWVSCGENTGIKIFKCDGEVRHNLNICN